MILPVAQVSNGALNRGNASITPAVAALFAMSLAAIALILVIMFFVRRRRAARLADPTCGSCGYIVTGLTTFTCPECGSDLRQVGIIRGSVAKAKPARPLSKLLLPLAGWTILLPIVAWLISAGLYWGLWPMRDDISDHCTLIPSSRPSETIEFNSMSNGTQLGEHGFARTWNSRYAEFQLRTNRRQFLAHFNSSPWGDYSDASGTEFSMRGVPVAADVKAYFAGNAIDTKNPEVIAETEELAAFLAAFNADPLLTASDWMHRNSKHFSVTNADGGGRVGPSVDPGPFIGLWLLPWAGIAYWRVRRWKALPTTALPQPTPMPPRTPGIARTLTVMFSDIVGFTSISAAIARGRVVEVSRWHHDVVAPIAHRLGGRITKSLGDGLLLTFDSATDAVRAGLEIQEAAKRTQSGLANLSELTLRIGIATGEVILADNDVLGQTVNLASRLQSAGKAGEVLFSESTWATVNRMEVGGEELPAFELKGFTEPVRVFRAIQVPAPLS
jgi:class 3 adenylate cyclase/predicted RNA-binding Zn-ribbon protein involved in translation (DUF1610 family)